MSLQTPELSPRLAVSRNEAAVQLGCSLRHIDYLIAQGKLKRVQIGVRKVAVTWPSLLKLVGEAA
jgi:excisionase family DNA binding protein